MIWIFRPHIKQRTHIPCHNWQNGRYKNKEEKEKLLNTKERYHINLTKGNNLHISETPLTILIQYLRAYTKYATKSSTCHTKSYVNRLLRQQATVHTSTHAHETQPHVRLSIYLSIYLWLYSPLLDLGPFFSFLFIYAVGRTPWMGNQLVARKLPTHRTTQRV
jgi:hypothetical protein